MRVRLGRVLGRWVIVLLASPIAAGQVLWAANELSPEKLNPGAGVVFS